MTVQVNSNFSIGFDEYVATAAQFDTNILESLHQKIGRMLASRRDQNFMNREKMLLQKIDQPLLSEADQKQYDFLREKQMDQTISETEHRTYMKLLNLEEKNGVERLRSLVELAEMREIPLKTLMRQLNVLAINPRNAETVEHT